MLGSIRQLHRPTLVLAAALFFIFSGCGKGKSEPTPTTSLSPEVTELVRYYEEMRQFGRTGQIDSFWARRDSVTSAFTKDLYRRNQKAIDSVIVFKWVDTWPNIAGLPLIQDTSNGEWRRLVFVVDSLQDKSGRVKTMYPIVLFRKEGAVWKVSNGSRMSAYKATKKGEALPFSHLTFHDLFCIPPIFPNLDSLSAKSGPPPTPEREPKMPPPNEGVK